MMDNIATLFTLESTSVRVSGEYHSWAVIPPLQTRDGMFLHPMDADSRINTIRRPVHSIHRVDRGGAVQCDYIIIAPDLHEILNMPYEAELNKLAAKLIRVTEQAASAKKAITDFNKLPWHRRVVLALKGGI